MISLQNLSLSFGGFELFRDISFLVNRNDKIGLVGRNGAGKSTLLKVITGEQKVERGMLNIPSGFTVGYLPQQMSPANNRTVMEETLSAFSEIMLLEKKINNLTSELETRTDFESKEYDRLIHQLSDADDRFRILNGVSVHARAEQALLGLGFERDEFHRLTATLSGGWRMRIELAKVLLQEPDLLMLDEPTNHLDILSIQWLEDFLKSSSRSMILISHDKAFLDNITTRTLEISLGKIYDYKVNYSRYVQLRKERRDQQMASYLNQQKKIEVTERFIERFRYKATKAVQVQSRIKQLGKIERIEVDDEDTSAIHFSFPPAPQSGSIVIEAEDISKSYGDRLVLNKVSLTVERGEKVAFVGRNGEGKTTLSRILAGELDYTGGKLKLGHHVMTGYYAQNQDEILDVRKTVLETIDEAAKGDVRTKIRDILGAFLFSGEDVDKKVKVLSGGERSRLAMTKLLLEPYNLLILDEPTNHLDILSREVLKKTLARYNGTLIIVSHDRDFLHELTTKVFEFKNNKVKQFIGDIYEFLEKRKIASLSELEQKERKNKTGKPEIITEQKAAYEKKKEKERDIRKITNRLQKTEKNIEQLENEIKAMDDAFANPENLPEQFTDNSHYEKYNTLKKRLEEEMKLWEQLSEEMGKI